MKLSRRTIIKGIGATAASTAMTHTASGVLKDSDANTDTFRVQVAHQWGKDGLAAVIKNTSPHTVTITDITEVIGEYGRFNFSDLTRNGPLQLTAGEEVHVPFRVMATPVKPYGHFDNRLQKKIKDSLAIPTTNPAAQVSTTRNPRIV